MSFTLVTVTGTFKKQDGSAASGRVTFDLSSPLVDSSTNEIRQPVMVEATLNGSGTISALLTATDDPTTTPTGVTYTVVEHVTGAPRRVYSIEVPYNAAGGTLDLADAVPVAAETPPSAIIDGTVTLPGLRYASEPTLGHWRIGSGLGGWSKSLAIRGPRPWVDLMAYADGDGTDEGADLVAAVAAVPSVGGVLYAPPPPTAYASAQRIALKDNLTIWGGGRGSLFRALSGITTGFFVGLSANTVTDCTIRGVRIDMNYPTVTGALKAVQVSSGARIRLEDVIVENAPEIGVYFFACPDSKITRSTITTTLNDAIRVEGASHRCEVTSNIIRFNAGKGISGLASAGVGPTDCKLTDNDIEHSGDGVGSQELIGITWLCDRAIVSRNHARGSATHQDTGFSISANACTVTDNDVQLAGLHGITLGDGTNLITVGVLAGNRSKNNHQKAGGATRAAFSLQGASGVVIDANKGWDDQGVKTQEYGMKLTSCSALRIGKANDFTGNLTGEIEYTATTSSPIDAQGSGSPEGVLTALIGSTYRRTDGGASTSLYVKESGTGNTGWVAK